jgi:hypothetical protein
MSALCLIGWVLQEPIALDSMTLGLRWGIFLGVRLTPQRHSGTVFMASLWLPGLGLRWPTNSMTLGYSFESRPRDNDL